ncbi:GMP synthase [Sphingobium amiense]|uniref:GMP synthase n=1 Tax=Sphingobium amiense TaxID=135719 RepID=A0A494W8R0_9SPHN|nr:glutamine amidotransferase [Sphingobium amiense]BBD96772.1 GMP synthase [Sphingobium amiense]
MSGPADKKLLIVKTGTLRERAAELVDRFGDQEAIFLAATGHDAAMTEVVEVYTGAPIPLPPSSYAGVIVTGAGAMVTDREPWMEQTASWLREAVAQEVPTLGVCFGHQLLSHALGGEVGVNPRGMEAGTVDVAFNDDAADDRLFADLPEHAGFGAHHYQTVLKRPDGAQVLASNDVDAHQALRFGPVAWGVQFHPEFDRSFTQALVDVAAEGIVKAGVDVDAIRAGIEDMPHGPELLRRFIAIVEDRA